MTKEVTSGGLVLAGEYYQDYGRRARELRAQGQKIIGYICAYVPLEIITAAGLVPFRIKGDIKEPITKADTQMETIVCPLVRSGFDVTLKGRYDFLDGIVIPHACDSMCRTYDIWKYSLGLSYSHLVNLPHSVNEAALEFFRADLGTFRVSLERFTGREITRESLSEAVKTYNDYRARVRELYQLRRLDPPLISGTEVDRVLVAAMSLPVAEASALVSDVICEMERRENPVAKRPARIMLFGAEENDVDFIELIEDLGANVVTDFLCPGLREFGPDTDITADPLVGIAARYLGKIDCPRTYRDQEGSYRAYLAARFGHLGQLVRDYRVNGVVLHIYRYCDPFGFDVPAIKSYFETMGTPVLYLEDDYSMSAVGRLRTRIQAFLELIG